MGVTVHREWLVVDLWWTEEPVTREFREVTRRGRKLVERRDETGKWVAA